MVQGWSGRGPAGEGETSSVRRIMRTVLIVEDDAAMLRGLKDNFEAKGYYTLTAVDGKQGLEAALREKPDLILLDIMLPELNGYEVCSLRDIDQLVDSLRKTVEPDPDGPQCLHRIQNIGYKFEPPPSGGQGTECGG